MGKRAGNVILALLVSAITMFSGVAVAGAADTITASLTCCTFAPGPYSQDLGEIPTFENPVGADAPHNVTSTTRGPDGGPLFRSQTIAAASSSPVDGTQYLTGGTYPFYCTLHGLSMSGELVVDGGKGEVVTRPAIRASVAAQRLRAIRRSGVVTVAVRALAGSPVVNLQVKGGARTIASATGIKVNTGATRKVRLRLTKAGRKAVSKGRRVVISVKGSVAFGSPSSARRTIR
jgi:plastocyanin